MSLAKSYIKISSLHLPLSWSYIPISRNELTSIRNKNHRLHIFDFQFFLHTVMKHTHLARSQISIFLEIVRKLLSYGNKKSKKKKFGKTRKSIQAFWFPVWTEITFVQCIIEALFRFRLNFCMWIFDLDYSLDIPHPPKKKDFFIYIYVTFTRSTGENCKN